MTNRKSNTAFALSLAALGIAPILFGTTGCAKRMAARHAKMHLETDSINQLHEHETLEAEDEVTGQDAQAEPTQADEESKKAAMNLWGTDDTSTANTVAFEQATAQNDPRLNLFGEVNGVAGLPGQFAASEAIKQVSFATEGADYDPDIDTTGQFVVYSSTQHSETSDIYRKRVEGTTVTRLTSDPADDMMPSFSPDNSQIAFTSNRFGNLDIFVMDANGGPAIQITSDTAQEMHPSWSPDGRFLIYCRLGEASGRWELWLTEVGNPAYRQFVSYGLFPEWCPDPSVNRIAYQQARHRGSRLFGVWTIDLVDGEARRPTEIASAANAAAINPAWSFDGKMLTFSTIVDPDSETNPKPGWADVWAVNIDGSGKINLTNGEFSNLWPTWAPDGRIFFVSDRSGVDNVWALTPEHAIKTAAGPNNYNTDTEVAEVPTE